MRLIFTPFDEDGNGILDFEEFLLIMCTFASYTRAETLMYLFKIFDTDNGGSIDRAEFARLVCILSPCAAIYIICIAELPCCVGARQCVQYTVLLLTTAISPFVHFLLVPS